MCRMQAPAKGVCRVSDCISRIRQQYQQPTRLPRSKVPPSHHQRVGLRKRDPPHCTGVRHREPLYRGGSARVPVKTRKINRRFWTVAGPFPTPGARINSPSLGPRVHIAACDVALELLGLRRFQLPFCLPGQFVGTSLFDLALQFLDRLILRVFFENVSLVDRLLEGNESLLKRNTFGGHLRLRDVPLDIHPTRPIDTVDDAGQISSSQFQLAEDGLHVLLVDPFRVLGDGDFGDLARQPGVPEGGLGQAGPLLLVVQSVFDSGRVEFADELAFLYPRVGWKDRDDGGLARNRVVVVKAERLDHLGPIRPVLGSLGGMVVSLTFSGMYGRDLRAGGKQAAGDEDDGGDGLELGPEHGVEDSLAEEDGLGRDDDAGRRRRNRREPRRGVDGGMDERQGQRGRRVAGQRRGQRPGGRDDSPPGQAGSEPFPAAGQPAADSPDGAAQCRAASSCDSPSR